MFSKLISGGCTIADKENAMEVEDGTPSTEAAGDVNLANAIDLSESEDEEEMEDLIDDFTTKHDEFDVRLIDFLPSIFSLAPIGS